MCEKVGASYFMPFKQLLLLSNCHMLKFELISHWKIMHFWDPDRLYGK